jgi:hypothetical protein
VYELTSQLSAKNSGGGYLPPDEFSRYCLLAQLKTIDQLYSYLDYNQKVITLLSDVMKVENQFVSNQTFPRPDDYYKYVASSAMNYNPQTKKWGQSEIEYIGQTELASRLNSDIITPTPSYPVITESNTGFRVDPEEVGVVKLTYLIEPDEPVWAAVDPNVVPPVFDPTASTDFVLSDKFTNILVNYVTQMFGIELNEELLIQATVQNLVEGL